MSWGTCANKKDIAIRYGGLVKANNADRPEVWLRYQTIDFKPQWGSFDREVPQWARLIVRQNGAYYRFDLRTLRMDQMYRMQVRTTFC